MNLIKKIIVALMPTTWLAWLNGYKTVIGAFFVAICVILQYLGIIVPKYVIDIAIAILGVGIIHKLQKTQDAADKVKNAIEELQNNILND